MNEQTCLWVHEQFEEQRPKKRKIQTDILKMNQNSKVRKELLVVILDLETNTFNESLILAQDERWRRA